MLYAALLQDLNHYGGVLEAIEQNSPDARIFVLIHKMDLVAEEHRDLVFQERQQLVITHSRGLSPTFFKTR
jgi:Ras-related GTP-binding protein A/B